MRRLSLIALVLVLFAGACEQQAAPEALAPQAPGAPVTGVITLSQAASVEPGNVLYIIARKSESGPPAAVKRIADPRFPLAFELGPKDSMVPGIEFTGPLSIKARLSRSGDAMPRAGDIEGVYPEPVEPGQSGIEILLAQVR
ncbi:MAG: hypothetical protein KDH09_11485 [Chrysiogenetes bacterium]|nr:hypothetical protein [Chrysiogenetes bacterium]